SGRPVGSGGGSVVGAHRLVALLRAGSRSIPSSVRAIAVSQRGRVDSDKPPTGYRVEEFATSNEDRGSQARTVGWCPTAWSAVADKVVRFARQSEVLRSGPRVRFHFAGGWRGRVRARLQSPGRRHVAGRGPDGRVRGRPRPQERGSQERPLRVSR